MSAPPKSRGEPVTDKRQLVEYLAAGTKPRDKWRIGTEHEKFVFNLKDLRTLPYDGPAGIRAMLEGLTRFGWEPVLENGNPIALAQGRLQHHARARRPVRAVGRAARDAARDLRRGEHASRPGEAGRRPSSASACSAWASSRNGRARTCHWMPKGRYKIMRDYMPKKGKLGLDMMLRTCTVQVNLDFADRSRHGEEVPRRASRCSRSRPRCSPIRRSPRASRTAS